MEQQKLNIPLHTIILTIGPSNCGKSYLIQNSIIPQILEKYENKIKVVHISSDKIRQELACEDLNKYNKKMLHISEQAFDLLFNKVKNHSSYPTNTELIFVDTTGLDLGFRNKIIEIAKGNNYNVGCIMFDYKNKADYYEFANNERLNYLTKQIITKHIDKFRTQTLRETNKKDYKFVFKIKSNKDLNNIDFTVQNSEKYITSILPNKPEDYIIIGDIHGCLNELKFLLIKHGFKIENNIIYHENLDLKIVLVGDYVDKGYAIKETIEFIHENQNWFKIILGNHENFVYKYLIGKINNAGDLIEKYFNSILILQNDEELKNKFFDLVSISNEFLKNDSFVVTHAPCKNKYLGKMDEYSLKKQRNIMYAKRIDFNSDEEHIEKIYEELSFIETESRHNQPYHVFGHIAVCSAEQVKNKINIDTGCAYGNKLMSVVINDDKKPHFVSVNSPMEEKQLLYNIFNKRKVADIDIMQINPKERGRIYYAIENKVNYISGTVCPANKNIEDGTLEDLELALDYYKNNNIQKVIMQTKYMGSRCNIYLHRDIEKCYSTTRNGYIIKKVDLTEIYKQLHQRDQIKKEFEDPNLMLMLLDAELMPWVVLGKSLVDNQFIAIERAITIENDFIKENEFEQQYKQLVENYKNSGFGDEIRNLTKKEQKDKYSEVLTRTYSGVYDYQKSHVDSKYVDDALNIFREQIKLYGSEEEINIKPFSILKYVNFDGSEKLFFEETNENVFKIVNDDEYQILDFTDQDYINKAKEFYNKQTFINKKEGVVIKPEKIYNKGIAPYMKVRNERYLTIIYGFDYLTPFKYNRLIKKKNISKKLKASIDEFETGKRLLEISYNMINKDNKDFISNYYSMIQQENYGQFFDPRL